MLPVGIHLYRGRKATLLRARDTAHHSKALAAIDCLTLVFDFIVGCTKRAYPLADVGSAAVVYDDDRQAGGAKRRKDGTQRRLMIVRWNNGTGAKPVHSKSPIPPSD